jgi:CRP-like cAMP-binding protein
MSDEALRLLLKKLNRLGELGPEDKAAINSLTTRTEDVPSGELLVREGDVPRECCVLVRGYACRHKTTRDGARQIVSFHMAGDILDVQHLQLPRADHNVETITAATVAWISSEPLRSALRQHPRLNDALWRDALIDASIFREWVLNVGRRDAKSRIAHMLCEFAVRHEAAGLGSPERFTLPITQEQIADATGLTPVHVNRSLQALRQSGVIEGSGREIRISDWQTMCEVADFDAAYLHQAAA